VTENRCEANLHSYSNIQTFPHFCQYSARLMAFRNAHPALRPADFFTGTSSAVNGLKDITWYAASGQEADTNYLTNSSNHFLAYRLNGQGVVSGEPAASIYVGYNGWSDWVTATLPSNLPGKQWYRVMDTSDWMESRDNSNAPGQEEALTSSSYALSARSLLLLIEK
jgi:isoamylase